MIGLRAANGDALGAVVEVDYDAEGGALVGAAAGADAASGRAPSPTATAHTTNVYTHMLYTHVARIAIHTCVS